LFKYTHLELGAKYSYWDPSARAGASFSERSAELFQVQVGAGSQVAGAISVRSAGQS